MNETLNSLFLSKTVSPMEAVKHVRSGDTVYIGSSSSVAYALVEALGQRADELHDITLAGGMVVRDLKVFNHPAFDTVSFFMGANSRRLVDMGISTYTSQHLHNIEMWCKETVAPNVAFLEVSPPDSEGNMSYGAAGVGLHCFMAECAQTVILQINSNVPYVFGQRNVININEADFIVYSDDELSENLDSPADDATLKISNYIVDMISDGDCLQLGIGGISGAVGYGLERKNDLGIHTELMTNSLMHLMKLGVANNSRKTLYPGKTVAGFSFGSKELYDFIDKNEQMYYLPFPIVNDPYVIAKNDNMISVNTAIAVDIFGQVNAENIAGRQYSGIGGQVDFVRGAQMSKGGKSIIALQSTGNSKKLGRYSKVNFRFPQGTAVTTSRADVQYIVTEFGAVNLQPLTMRDRVKAIISLAHPDYRDQLTDDAKSFNLL